MIGLFGGSFNPIHFGHLITAKQLLEQGKLEKIIFLPCNKHPFKKKIKVKPEHRIKMIEIATKNEKNFLVSDYEAKKKGFCYTYETLKHFSKKYSDIAWIIGENNLKTLPQWKNYDLLVKEFNIIVVSMQCHTKTLKKSVKKIIGKKGVFMDLPIKTNISSSFIRREFRKKRIPYYFAPRKVIDYAKKQGLY